MSKKNNEAESVETKEQHASQNSSGKTKLNKYGFIHLPKKLLPRLPFQPEEPLQIVIAEDSLTIRR